MKKNIFLFLFILGACFTGNSQKITGYYEDYFGNKLILRSDSSFNHQWRFDISSTWFSGKWINIADTVFFESILIEDTLTYFDSIQNSFKDSLVVSMDEISNRISLDEYLLRFYYTFSQEEKPKIKKLVFKRNKLFIVDEQGKLIKKRSYFFAFDKKLPFNDKVYKWLHQKKHPRYYFKISENIPDE